MTCSNCDCDKCLKVRDTPWAALILVLLLIVMLWAVIAPGPFSDLFHVMVGLYRWGQSLQN